MKAIVYHQYGSPDVLTLQEVSKPIVEEDGVLVHVHAASLNPLDWHLVRGMPYVVRLMIGLRKPKLNSVGAEFAGLVEAIGGNVKQFKVGDAVFGRHDGACAEYVSVLEKALAPKPASLTFEQAATVPIAGVTALQIAK